MTMRRVPGDGVDDSKTFPPGKALPAETPATARRELSKVRSNWSDTTWAPPDEVSRTATAMPVCPGVPEPSSTEKVASGACAMAID